MEVPVDRKVGRSDLCPGCSLESLPVEPEMGLTAFPAHLPAHGAEGQAVDETGAVMPVRPEHQGIDVMPPCQTVGRHDELCVFRFHSRLSETDCLRICLADVSSPRGSSPACPKARCGAG